MRRTAFLIAVVFLIAGLGVACGEDTSAGDDEFGEVGTEEDTGPDDISGPPEDTQSPPEDTTEEPGDDTGPVDTGTPDTGVDTGIDTGIDTGVDTGTADGDTAMSGFGPGSFVRELFIDKQNPGTPRCCFDYDNDPDPDNAVADVIADVPLINISDANMGLNEDIESGDLIFLFEHKNWETNDWQNDSSIDVLLHPGADAMPDFEDNKMGNGTFEITQDSFDMNGDPKSKFSSAMVNSRDITAQGGKIELSITVGQGTDVDLKLQDADMEATAAQSSDVSSGGTVPLENGELGGIVTKEDFYTAVNENCMGCNAGQRISREKPGSDSWECNSSAGCSCTPSQLNDFCSVFVNSVENNADIDQDSNGTNDALTFGASFRAVAAEIVGIEQ